MQVISIQLDIPNFVFEHRFKFDSNVLKQGVIYKEMIPMNWIILSLLCTLW